MSLEFEDIQSGILRPRPNPYASMIILLRIDDRKAGRELKRRAVGVVNSCADLASKTGDAWVSLALTFEGLKTLGVPQESLDSFSPEFQRGMAVRAAELGDTGESAPENWEKPFGTSEIHVVLTAEAPNAERLEVILARGRKEYEEMPGIKALWRQDCYTLPTGKEHFGYNDGIGQPDVEGSGLPLSNPKMPPIKAGEFVLGYLDEMGNNLYPKPDVLGRNGSYTIIRKLHQQVTDLRKFLKAKATSTESEDRLGAKMMGRWPSGAPLARCPMHDDSTVGADPTVRNDFIYKDDDPRGLKTPIESHARRMNPRDSEVIGEARLHRIIRRGTSYGPHVPAGVLEDDGVDRGTMFAFVCAHIDRQFEFLHSQWMNSGEFAGRGNTKDPIVGTNDGTGTFTIPERPIRQCVQGLPRFVVVRGGEYAFMPSLSTNGTKYYDVL